MKWVPLRLIFPTLTSAEFSIYSTTFKTNMYDDIIDLAMDQQLLTEINNSINLKQLPIWRELHSRTDEEIKTLEQNLIVNASYILIMYFVNSLILFMKSYLKTEHSVDKAVLFVMWHYIKH